LLPSRFEEWQVGTREFPAWILPAVAAIGGLLRQDGRWVLRNHQDRPVLETRDRDDSPGAQWLRYRLEAAGILQAACDASPLPAGDLAEVLRNTTGQAIGTGELERWLRGDDEFPAWLVPAVVEVSGLVGQDDYWAPPPTVEEAPHLGGSQEGLGGLLRRRRRTITIGVVGLALCGLAGAAGLAGARDLFLTNRTPKTSFAAPETPSPSGAISPTAGATADPASGPVPSPSAPAPTPPPSRAVAPAPAPATAVPVARTPSPTPVATTSPPRTTPTPSPSHTPTPTPAPPNAAPPASAASGASGGGSGGLLGGVLNLLGL
jgi:hypothetical protein